MGKSFKEQETAFFTEVLYRASAAPIGLLLMAGDPDRARQRLYQVRAMLHDPELDKLQIAASPLPEGNIILIKVQRQELPDL